MPGSSGDVDPKALHFDDGPPYSHFHFANPFALPLARMHGADLMRRARAAGLTTSLDTGWDAQGRWNLDIDPCLPFTDLLFVNGSEATMLSGVDDPDAAAQVLLDKGAGEVVIKLGERGSVVYAGNERIAAPAFEVAVKDTTGAGDCFAAGFLAALHRGLDYRSAARIANAVGGMSVESLGAVGGVRIWEETMNWIAAARVAN
jgi:sugar/nucleoside kinase (ribokinase family)